MAKNAKEFGGWRLIVPFLHFLNYNPLSKKQKQYIFLNDEQNNHPYPLHFDHPRSF